MKTPELSPQEPERLRAIAALHILDSEPEASFDALTKLVALALGVPIALISIVDERRQWFKSKYGLDVPETSREVSFCGHVVAFGEELVIPDARTDERFADNPLVVGEPHVRFYVGEPLQTADGLVLGTLCAIDQQPRQLSPSELETMRLLASQVVALLELRANRLDLQVERIALAEQRRFFELSLELLCTADVGSGHFRALNPAWETTLGWTLEELRSQPFLDLVHPDDRERTRGAAATMAKTDGAITSFENRYRHKDGSWVVLAWTGTCSSGTFYAAARNISAFNEKKEQLLSREAELLEGDRRWRALFEAMAEGVVVQDKSGAITAHNSAAERILGLSRDQLLGVTSVDPMWHCVREDGSVFPGDQHPAMVALRTGVPMADVVMGVHIPSGELTWIGVNSQPLVGDEKSEPHAVITTFRDITEQKAAARLAERLARQERLVTTGTLAAGVGHEINNPLTYVLTNLDVALEELRAWGGDSPTAPIPQLIEVLNDAREGGERVRKIVRGLRSLAREDSAPRPSDVNAAVEMSINMAMHELRQVASVVRDFGSLPPVMADESRLTQVLVNLLLNAAQSFAVRDPSANRVEVTTSVARGGRIRVAVADNGPGIAADVLPRIFDPFFTTKPVGKGTGLGLSISHSIVISLDGELTCETEIGRGTTFTVLLPSANPHDSRGRTSDAAQQTLRGRVLLIDDEEGSLRAITRLLERDHGVTAVSDPRQALGLLERGRGFDVVFCDLMMPHLTGAELYQLIADANPAMAARFVFLTGGVLNEDIDHFLASVPNERLEKPFNSQSLRQIAASMVSLRTRSGQPARR